MLWMHQAAESVHILQKANSISSHDIRMIYGRLLNTQHFQSWSGEILKWVPFTLASRNLVRQKPI